MKLTSNILFILISVFLISCDENRVFDEYKSVGSAWNKDSIVSFDLPKLESSKNYNLFVNLRNNDNYPFNNLFLLVSKYFLLALECSYLTVHVMSARTAN